MAGDAGESGRRLGFRSRRRRDEDEPDVGPEVEEAPESGPEEQQAAEERRRERLAHQLSQQWEQLRAARRDEEPVIETGPSNLAPAKVPWAFDLAAAWAWRFVVICAAGGILLWLVRYFAVIAFPLVIALFIAALSAPVVTGLRRIGLPRKLAALLVVIAGLGAVGLLLYFVGQQVSTQAGELSNQLVKGLEEIRHWLQTGPLHATDSQIDDALDNAQDWLTTQGSDLPRRVPEVGVALGHLVAGFFIILFASYFFLADGHLIWAWLVRIFPRGARSRADSSGRVAWVSMTQFVRATVLVAATDAIGIMIVAAILKVPLVTAIGVLVFLGAFVPMIGATISGAVAVLLALVAQGPLVALLMLGGVILVQQIEAHVLQPFLMGRFVSVHPLGVILAIAAGVLVAGIPGALVAVPLAAALNAVVQHLAVYAEEPEEATEEAELPEAAEAVEDPVEEER